MRNLKLVIEYDGTAYLGWQRQTSPNTVQQAMEDAVERITGERTTVFGASRTDTGVHALGQTAHFHTASDLPPERMRAALNAVLPEDVVVRDVSEAPESFHAQFMAVGKRYEYTILNREPRAALDRLRCWHVRYALDLDAMRRAAAALVGTRDFAVFAASGSDRKTTVRTLTRCELTQDGDRIILAVEGDGFLYNMVRTIAGTLVDIGRGHIAAERMPDILASCDRTQAGVTAPPHGLCLVRVDYAPEGRE